MLGLIPFGGKPIMFSGPAYPRKVSYIEPIHPNPSKKVSRPCLAVGGLASSPTNWASVCGKSAVCRFDGQTSGLIVERLGDCVEGGGPFWLPRHNPSILA